MKSSDAGSVALDTTDLASANVFGRPVFGQLYRSGLFWLIEFGWLDD